MYDIPVTAEQGRSKLRQEFLKNKHVRDIRSIDLLVIKANPVDLPLPWGLSVLYPNGSLKGPRLGDPVLVRGQMELVETLKIFKQKSHVMAFFKDTVEPKPADFMSKFLSGQ
ncbi:hypothetical protein HPB47_001970 [Ixodes persulcatus]|uniref:Uncharacterized protein n=1 Tax=Ixodes persulcatus TaxID=34615 RepID=A0AC60PMG6_IXOPE|nr:hypothetical protein HPB47_001970 [Ixodes persulcatus]